MHQSHYSAYVTGGISTSYCPSIFLSSAMTQLWHKGPQFQCGGLSAPIPMWGPQCLNFNVGGLNASNFNVGASISMCVCLWGGGGAQFQCTGLNFNVGASVPQFQCRSLNFKVRPQFQCGKNPPKCCWSK